MLAGGFREGFLGQAEMGLYLRLARSSLGLSRLGNICAHGLTDLVCSDVSICYLSLLASLHSFACFRAATKGNYVTQSNLLASEGFFLSFAQQEGREGARYREFD